MSSPSPRTFLGRLVSGLGNILFSTSRRSRLRFRNSEQLEDRTLLSNMNLIAAQQRIVLGGGNEVNNFTVDFDGTNYTVTDTSGTAINAIGGLSGFDTNPAANIVTFDPTAVAAFTRLEINPNGGDDSVIINSWRGGAEGLTVFDDASEGTDTVTINGDIGTAGNRVASDNVVIRGENINLGADIFTNNRDVAIGGTSGVSLTNNVAVDAGTGAVTFEQAIDGMQGLTVVGGVVHFDGTVGGGTALTTLGATGSTVRAQAVTVNSGNMTFQADLFIPQGNLNGTANLTIRRNTAGVQTFDADDFPFVGPGFNSVTIGSSLTTTLNIASDGDNNPVTGALSFDADLTLIGQTISLNDHINQGAHSVTLQANNALNFIGVAAATGTGDVNIQKLTAGGTLTVTGNLGVPSAPFAWGANVLNISGVGSTVTFTGGVGNAFAGISATADTLNFNHPSAVSAQGDITLNGAVGLSGGISSVGGSIVVNGNTTLGGNVLFKVSGGEDLLMNGTVSGAGNILVRNSAGAPNQIRFNDAVNISGTFQVDASGANTAVDVWLDDVTAADVLVRASDEIYVAGNIVSGANVLFIGTTEFGIAIPTDHLIQSGGAADQYIQLSGPVMGNLGTENVTLNSGAGRTVLGGAVSNLNDLEITSGGLNYITQPITVANNFSWTVGVDANGVNDRIIRAGAGSITAGNQIDLTADVLQGIISGVNATAPTVNLSQRGAGN
ncbi:MAG: hypothetical protein R3C18_10065 [Planctomycetaceae bacterium]